MWVQKTNSLVKYICFLLTTMNLELKLLESGEFVMFSKEWLWSVIVPICQMAALEAVLEDQKMSQAFQVPANISTSSWQTFHNLTSLHNLIISVGIKDLCQYFQAWIQLYEGCNNPGATIITPIIICQSVSTSLPLQFLIFPPTWETCRPACPPPPRLEQPVPRKASETQPNHSSLPEMVEVNQM